MSFGYVQVCKCRWAFLQPFGCDVHGLCNCEKFTRRTSEPAFDVANGALAHAGTGRNFVLAEPQRFAGLFQSGGNVIHECDFLRGLHHIGVCGLITIVIHKQAPQKPLEDAIQRAGGITELARQIGEKPSTISMWKKRCNVPAEYCPSIERATGVRCEDLQPRVEWAVLRSSSASCARCA